jgi:hypothetical protein
MIFNQHFSEEIYNMNKKGKYQQRKFASDAYRIRGVSWSVRLNKNRKIS